MQVLGQAFRSQPAAQQWESCGKHVANMLQAKYKQVSVNDKTATVPALLELQTACLQYNPNRV